MYILLFCIAVSIANCSKSAKTVTDPIPTDFTVVSQGTFTNGVHNTSGTVKLSKDPSGKKYLVFENFNTESGPDLRIWLAEDNAGKNYSEITKTVNNGTYKLEVATEVDTNTKKNVLVWCKQFSVLFGSAILK